MTRLVHAAVIVGAASAPAHADRIEDPRPACEQDLRVHLPLVAVGVGTANDGNGPSVAIGYGQGTRDGCDEGYVISRMLVGFRFADRMETSLTYGWYENVAGSLGFDFGLEGDRYGGGPILRVTLGAYGLGLRFTGGLRFADQTELAGALELAIDVTDLVDQLRR